MSKLNCKVGDLAIVVSATLPQNLGQIVEVVGLQTAKPFALLGLGHIWQVRTVSGRDTLVYRYNEFNRFVRYAEGPVPDCKLRPVSGLSLGDGSRELVGADTPAPVRGRRRPLASRVPVEP